jgi:hypothetical protein
MGAIRTAESIEGGGDCLSLRPAGLRCKFKQEQWAIKSEDL